MAKFGIQGIRHIESQPKMMSVLSKRTCAVFASRNKSPYPARSICRSIIRAHSFSLEGVLVEEGDEVLWKRDAPATRFAAELVNAQSEECAFDMLRIPLKTQFLVTGPNLGGSDLIVKRSSRQVYDAAFVVCKSRPGARVVLEGQQGTGKSRNLIYLLKKLLESGTLVLLQSCKRGMMYAFVPADGTYTVFSIRAALFNPEYSPAMHLYSTILLFDPTQEKEEPGLYPCTIVIAASTSLHRYSNIMREINIWQFTVNPYTADEAAEYFRLLGHHIPQEEFAQRFFQVGGSLRSLWNSERSMMTSDAQRAAIQGMSERDLDIAFSNDAKWIGDAQPDSVGVYSSAVFTYSNFADPSDCDTYRCGTVTKPISAAVEDMVAEAAYGRLYAQLKHLLCEERHAEAGYLLEVLGRVALARGGRFKVRELATGSKETVLQLPPATGGVRATMSLLEDWKALSPEASHSVRTVLYPLKKSIACVDLVDSRLRAYSFTALTPRSIAYPSLTGQLDTIDADAHCPLDLYFCVPDFTFEEGCKSFEATEQKKTVESDDLLAAMSKRLKLHMLRLPTTLRGKK